MNTTPQPHVPAIQGVATSIAGFVGASADGLEDEAVLVTSVVEYERAFGTVDGELSRAVGLFFENGGTRAYVVRTVSKIDEALAALEGLPVGLLALPDTGGLNAREAARVVTAAADVCQRQRWFFVVDPPGALAPAAIETWARHLGSQPNAAVYMPRLRLPDGTETAASGAVAGVAARTDIERGVWVAPAGSNGRVRGVVDVTRHLSDTAVERGAGAGVNAIRNPGPAPRCRMGKQDLAAERVGAAAIVHLFISTATSPQFFDVEQVGIPVLYTDAATGRGMVKAGSAQLIADPPSWGFLRVVDARTGQQVAKFDHLPHVRDVTPPNGDWSIHNNEVLGDRTYASWYSHGIVALGLTPLNRPDVGNPRMVGQFVPAGAPSQSSSIPSNIAEVWGVAVRQTDGVIFASDMNSGLWIIRPTGPAAPS
jgi:hypothetical protein